MLHAHHRKMNTYHLKCCSDVNLTYSSCVVLQYRRIIIYCKDTLVYVECIITFEHTIYCNFSFYCALSHSFFILIVNILTLLRHSCPELHYHTGELVNEDKHHTLANMTPLISRTSWSDVL